jgi:hypothetical protein
MHFSRPSPVTFGFRQPRCTHQGQHGRVLQKTILVGQILLEQRALRVDTHALLEALVQKHLEMHGGDAQKSLASLSSVGSS